MADTAIEKKKITFYDSHKPSLQSGTYSIEAKQIVSLNEGSATKEDSFPKKESSEIFEFKIEGPQFSLEDNLIHSVYPPVNSRGDFHADIPSITLNRSTLPWERSPQKGANVHASWLCLLVFDEAELKQVKDPVTGLDTKQVTEVINEALKDISEKIPINYISIDKALLSILPTFADLNYLSYASISDETDGEEKAVILANRLPKKGSTSTVYLVSVENRYDANGFKNINTNEKIDMPFLYKWQFHTDDDNNYFIPKGEKDVNPLLTDILFLNSESFEAILKYNVTNAAEYKKKYAIGNSTFHGLLKDLKGGVGPFSYPSSNSDYKLIIQQGAVAAMHTYTIWEEEKKTVEEQKKVEKNINTVSWYRGPFQAAAYKIDNSLIDSNLIDFLPPFIKNVKPVNIEKKSIYKLPQQSEQLFLYDSTTKMCDVTYAAAWELGKLIALNDKAFNVPFFRWKQNNALVKRQIELGQNVENLSVQSSLKLLPLPEIVVNKFEAWKRLEGIPLHYIIPNQKMTPAESIRHFKVDKYWVNSFLSGVFSIGNTVDVDLSEYLTGNKDKTIPTYFMESDVSGFILNSKMVSGWPDFELVASGTTTTTKGPLILKRRDILVPNMVVFLFDGIINNLDFHLHPAKMHSGFVFEDGKYVKNIVKDIPWKDKDNRVVDINGLAVKLNMEDKVANFASEMMESTPKVLFEIGKG